jgi:hypothetical protein
LLLDKYAHADREGFCQLLLRGNSSDSHHRLELFWRKKFRRESV